MFFNGWDGFGSFIRLLDYAVRALSNPTEGRRSRRWCVCVIMIVVGRCMRAYFIVICNNNMYYNRLLSVYHTALWAHDNILI